MTEKLSSEKQKPTQPGPQPKQAPGQPKGADLWAFHGGLIQRKYDQSIQYGRERKAKKPDFEGNNFGNQPPKEE